MSATMLCQRCRLPLTPHRSVAHIGLAQAGVFGSQDSTTAGEQTPEDASFIVLTESLAGPNPLTPLGSNPLKGDHSRDSDILERLYDFLTAKTDVDLPLCGECAEAARSGLKSAYDDACSERDAYIAFLNRLRDEPVAGSAEMRQLEQQIAQLEREAAQALAELQDAEGDLGRAKEELAEAKKEIQEQEARDDEVYQQRNALELEAQRQEVEHRRLKALEAYQEMQLQRLQRTNVYNDVFCIGHDGSFGTINGLRLGRLRDKRVEWAEINAAWGQTLLLLATVINKLGVRIPEYRLKPLGSMSRIDKLELDPETGEPTDNRAVSLELYSSGDYSFERLLNHKRLDTAMVAFLEVLDRVGQFVEARDPSLKLPYAVEGDRIGGCSIKLSMSTSNETWTAACKYVLTNAKWILAYVVSQ